MWFRLSQATFTTNIGTMDTWSITRVLGAGVSYSGNTSVDKGAALDATITLTDTTNYKVKNIVITMDGTDITSTVLTPSSNFESATSFTIAIPSVTGSVKITVTTENIGTGEESGGEKYTYTVNATPSTATVKLTATGYTDVSGTGSATITVSSGTTVNYAVSLSGYGPQSGSVVVTGNSSNDITLTELSGEGTITWTNQGYASGSNAWSSNTARACAKMVCSPGDILTIPDVASYTIVDLVSIGSDGNPLGYTSGSNLTYTTSGDTLKIAVPTDKTFTIDSGMVSVGLVFKHADGTTAMDISTLPTTYYRSKLKFINARWDTSAGEFSTQNTRLATNEYISASSSTTTVTITNIPDDYLADDTILTLVDCIAFDSDYNFLKLYSGGSSAISGSTMTITTPTFSSNVAYIKFTFKAGSAGSTKITPFLFENCVVTSN